MHTFCPHTPSSSTALAIITAHYPHERVISSFSASHAHARVPTTNRRATSLPVPDRPPVSYTSTTAGTREAIQREAIAWYPMATGLEIAFKVCFTFLVLSVL